MRWFITDDVPDLAARLIAAGEEVISEPSDWVTTRAGSIGHPRDYPLRALVEARRPDVVVLVDSPRLLPIPGGLLEFGYFRQATQVLRRTMPLVMLNQHDPESWRSFTRGACPGCICRPNDCAVYVSNDPGTVAFAKGSMRAALWAPGSEVGPLLAALEHVRARKLYQAPRDRGLW